MYIINLTYVAPLDKVDELRNEHVEFLEHYYRKSIFLMSGPKIPRTGGIILATNIELADLKQIIKEDPFWKNKIAEYDIIEFTATMTSREF